MMYQEIDQVIVDVIELWIVVYVFVCVVFGQCVDDYFGDVGLWVVGYQEYFVCQQDCFIDVVGNYEYGLVCGCVDFQ